MFDTYLGTTGGVYRLTGGTVVPLGLPTERVSALYGLRDHGGAILLAGSYGNGLYRSEDGGATWSAANAGLTAPACRWLGPDPLQPDTLLAGTEPARLFRSQDGGLTWQELAGVTAIPGHERWFLPYSPRAGALRNVYAPPDRSGRLFASVEVGGLLASGDGGQTWTCRPVLDDEDIHFITGHPAEPDLLYAALGYASLTPQHHSEPRRVGGIARSRDGGRTWRKLETDYTRAVLVPPSRPDLVLAAPAPEVGRGGRIVVSTDGGDTWADASAGVATPMADMIERFVTAPDRTIWAIGSGGGLLQATPGEWSWRSVLPADSGLHVQSVAFVVPDAA